MKSIKIFSVIVAVLCLSYVGYLFVDKTLSVNMKKYYVGVSLPLSGPQAAEGKELLQAINLMRDKINAKASKTQNFQLELVIKDDKNDPVVAKQVAQELVQHPQIFAVIGSYYASTMQGGAQDVYAQNKILTIAPYEGIASNRHNTNDFAFNMAYTNAAGVEHVAIYLKKILDRDDVLVIYSSDELGEDSNNIFKNKANKIGMKIYKDIACNTEEKIDENFIANNLKPEDKEKIKSVVLFTRKDAGLSLIKQLRKFGVNALIMGPHTFTSSKSLSSLDIADTGATNEQSEKDVEANIVYITSPFLYELANEDAVAYRQDFTKKYGKEPEADTAAAADAVLLLANALTNNAKDLAANCEKQHIATMVKNYLQGLTWESAVDGLTGNLFFNKENYIERDVFVAMIYEGEFQPAFTQVTKPKGKGALKLAKEVLANPKLLEEEGDILVDNQVYNVVDVVYVGLDFLKINDIDPKTMTVDAELFVWFKWEDPNVDVKGIKFINMMKKHSYTLLDQYDPKDGTKYAAYKVHGTFFVPYDLHKFPFDKQALPIYVAHKNLNSTSMMLVLDSDFMDMSPVTDINPEEWSFARKKYASILYRFKSTFGNPTYRVEKTEKSKVYFSTIKAEIEVARNVLPYIFNVFLPLAIIILISCLILRIPVDQFVLRTNTTSAAIMSILLYYIAQKATLPKVGYMMKSDYYFLLLFLFILCLQAFNISVNKYLLRNNLQLAQRLNRKFAILFVLGTASAYAAVSWLL